MADATNTALLDTRNAFLAKPKPRSAIVEFGGRKVEVRQPTLGERSRIIRDSQIMKGSADKDGDVEVRTDSAEMQVLAIICCSYLPDSNTKIFSMADREELKSHFAGGGIDALAKAAIKLFNVKEGDAAKKSEPTPTSGSGTTSPES